MNDDAILEFLRACRELTALCQQNGWIDNDTLRVEILARDAHHIDVTVQFEEVIVQGGGCATRHTAFGRLRLQLNDDGTIGAATVL